MIAESTRHAYREMFATVTGRSALEVTAAGDSAFDESLLDEVSNTIGVDAAVPLVLGPAKVSKVTDADRLISTDDGDSPLISSEELEAQQQKEAIENVKRQAKLYMMGIDPARDGQLRDYKLVEGRQIEKAGEIVLGDDLARGLNATIGDELKILSRSFSRQSLGEGLPIVKVVGLVRTTAHSRTQQGGLAIISIDLAQKLFVLEGKINSIQVLIKDQNDVANVAARLNKFLPEGVTARPPASRTQVFADTFLATERGLQVSSVFSMFLAMFIIFNTFLINISERRRQLAIMRTLGATGWQVRKMVLLESFVLGTIGVALGIGLGWFAAGVITNTLANVFEISLEPAEFTLWILAQAVGAGFGMSIAGAYLPARNAGRLTPLEGMSSVSKEDVEGFTWRYSAFGWLLFFGGGVVLIQAFLSVIPMTFAIYAAAFMLLGLVLQIHTVLGPITGIGHALLQPFLKSEATLAWKQILRRRMRSTLTAGVLFVAAAAGISMAYAILDSVEDIRDWYRQAIVGDFFVRAMIPDLATGESAPLPDEIDSDIRSIQGIRSLDTAKFVRSKASGQNVVVIVREYPPSEPVALDLVEGKREGLAARLRSGDVVIGSVLAGRTKLQTGDSIEFETTNGKKPARIAAVANDYLMGGMSVLMARSTAEPLLGVRGVDAYVVKVDPENMSAVKPQLEKICAKYEVLLHSFDDIRKTIDGIIKGTDRALWVLIFLGFLVASFGMVNTLTMNVLEQTRELGMLRVVAMTRSQVFRTILSQALLIGLAGLIPGTLIGLVLSWLLNRAAQLTLNHPIEYGAHPWMVLGVFVGSLILVVLAAAIPARRAANLDIASALHAE